MTATADPHGRPAALEPCPGCGELLLAIDGPLHSYVGASSACWTRFADISATLPGGGTPLRRLVIDAYMVQHPGLPERRAIQSVGLHLVALHLVLERGLAPDRLSAALQRVLVTPPAWRWLDPPSPNGPLSIGDVSAAAGDGRELGPVIDAYVEGIWAAWKVHHGVVVAWAKGA